jgi:hypothetical protein
MQNLDPTYLRYIYDNLIKGSVHPENASELPEGLIGLYEESFEEHLPVLQRQLLLQWFALFALLKKEVSVAFVAEVFGESESDILEFINTYASWFNSPEPGKFQLFHERLKVFVLQKLSEKEIQTIHEKLIACLELAIEEQQSDEFERYGLEFIGEHLYSFFDNKLFEVSLNKNFQDRQILILGNYLSIYKNLKFSLLLAKRNNERTVILKVSVERLRLRKKLHESFDLFYNSIHTNNLNLIANLIEHLDDKSKGFIILLFFYEFFEGRFNTHSLKSDFIKLFMEQLSFIEDDFIRRGWILPAPEEAKDFYLIKLKELNIDDFHFRKLLNPFDFNYDENVENESDDNENINFKEHNSDDINIDALIEEILNEKQDDFVSDTDVEIEDLNFDDSDYCDDENFDELIEEILSNYDEDFHHYNTNSEEEEDYLLKTFDEDDFNNKSEGDINEIIYEERKNQIINELIVSKDRINDLYVYASELKKIHKHFKYDSEIQLQLLLAISTTINISEFEELYLNIFKELERQKLMKNPILYSHEVEACCESLIEYNFFKKALDLNRLNSQQSMRENICEEAIINSYLYDKKIYIDVLKSVVKTHKINTSIYINKGELIKEFMLQENEQDFKALLYETNDLEMICGLTIDFYLDFLYSNQKILKIWIPVFNQLENLEIKSYSEIFEIFNRLTDNKNQITNKDLKKIEQNIINTKCENKLKKILICLKFFHTNENFSFLILSQLKSLIHQKESSFKDVLLKVEVQVLFFNTMLNCWSNLSEKLKDSTKLLFDQIYELTITFDSPEKTAFTFIINKELFIRDYISTDKKLDVKTCLVLLKSGFVIEAHEARSFCENSNDSLNEFEFWLEILERTEHFEIAIQKLDYLILNKFDDLIRDISIENQSFCCFPFVARMLNKLQEKGLYDELKMISNVVLNHIEFLRVSQDEKRKLLSIFSNTINYNVFKYLLGIISYNQKQLLSGSISYQKKYQENIQDKVYEELCLVDENTDVIESALIHLVKTDLFFNNNYDSLNETKDLFDFDYWLNLKAPI